jgi:PhnB protein
MDPFTAGLLAWIGASVINLAAVALIIVAETRDHARLYGSVRAPPPPKSGEHQSRRAWSIKVDRAMSPHRTHPPSPRKHTMPITLTPYLSFGGNTRDAFAFYEKALGAKIETMMSYAEMPASAAGDGGCGDGPPPSGDGIMHARLALPGGALLFAGDTPPGMPYEGMKGVMLAIQYDTIDQAHSAFHALSQGGQVTMPLAPAFWAKTFGMLTDRFGVSWAVNGEPIKFG